MANFKYDVVTLLELVESKPCIWDKHDENHKNKKIRDKNWLEVFRCLEDDYEELSEEHKKNIGEAIVGKWANIRDAFLRSIKAKNGQKLRKRYVYSDHLQFLLKRDEIESYFSQAKIEDDSIDIDDFLETESPSSPLPCAHKPTAQAHLAQSTPRTVLKRKLDDTERESPTELKKETTLRQLPSDEELLLLSFLPYIRDMTEAELLDFQMETLTTIKKIKKQRISNEPQHFSSPPS